MIGVAALLACVLAAPASAVWTHKGKGELKENASITLKGTVTLTTSAGNVACPAEIGGTLTASSSSGHVSSFAVSKASECDLAGSLAAICGTNGVTKVEKTGSWALTADETDITVTGINLDYTLAGCLIPSFRIEGSSTVSLDKATAIGSATLSGTQTLYNSLGEASGSAELKGTLAVTPTGTYGVKTAPLVETKWTDANEHLSEDGKLTLAGTFSFSGSGGGVSCPATVKLLLESSTVEEEEPEGEIESFTVSSPAGCDVSGGYASTCGTNSISSVEQTGTATLTATEEDFTISGLSLDYKFKSCAITTLRVEGSPTVSVSSPQTINSATFEGGSLQLYNAAGEKAGTASAGGSTSASPAGTFQLADHSHEAHTEETQHELETHEAETHEIETHDWETEESATAWEGFWVEDPEETVIGGEEEAETFTGFGEVSSTTGGLLFGPFAIELRGFLWNGPEHGEGAVEEAVVPGLIATNLPGCTATMSNNTETGSKWAITLTGEELDIKGMTFIRHFGAECSKYGIPSTWPIAGDLTGQYNNGTGCIEYANSGDLKIESTSTSVNTNGEVCLEL